MSAMVLFFEILMVLVTLAILWITGYVIYRTVVDES